MDAVAGLLDGPRAREAFVLRSSMDPPWSLRIADEAPLTVMALARGHAWIVLDAEPTPRRMQTGDVAIVRGPDHTPWPTSRAGRPRPSSTRANAARP